MLTASFMTFYYLRPMLAAELVYFIIFASRFVAFPLFHGWPFLCRFFALPFSRATTGSTRNCVICPSVPKQFPSWCVLMFCLLSEKTNSDIYFTLCSLNHFIFSAARFNYDFQEQKLAYLPFESTKKSKLFQTHPRTPNGKLLPNTNNHFPLCHLQGPSLTMAISPF